MIRIGRYKFASGLWGLMAFYLLNISIDAADPSPENVPEDLSFNDQESIIEIVIEQFMGFEDAIKEYDDNDLGNNKIKKQVKIDLLSSENEVINNDFNHPTLIVQYYASQEFRLVKGFFEIDSPPPKL